MSQRGAQSPKGKGRAKDDGGDVSETTLDLTKLTDEQHVFIDSYLMAETRVQEHLQDTLTQQLQLQLQQPADYDDGEVDDDMGSMENTQALADGQL